MDTIEPPLDLRPLTKGLTVPAILTLVGAVAFFYQPTAAGLVRLWNAEPTYLYGYLIPVLSLLTALAIWRRCGGPLVDEVPRGDVHRGRFFLLLGCAAHVGALFVDSLPLDVLALVIILRGGVQVFGGDVVHRYDPAIFLLLFLLPIPTNLIPAPTATLTDWVAGGADRLLEAAGVPTYLEGSVVQLSDFTIAANAASSGLHELEGTLALCISAATIIGGRLGCTILLLLSLPIALAVNIGRIFAAGIAYHEYGRPAAEQVLLFYEGRVPVGVAAGLVVVAALAAYALTTYVERSKSETA